MIKYDYHHPSCILILKYLTEILKLESEHVTMICEWVCRECVNQSALQTIQGNAWEIVLRIYGFISSLIVLYFGNKTEYY